MGSVAQDAEPEVEIGCARQEAKKPRFLSHVGCLGARLKAALEALNDLVCSFAVVEALEAFLDGDSAKDCCDMVAVVLLEVS